MKAQSEQTRILMSPFLSSNFEMQNYYQNKTKVNGVYPRTNIPKIKDGT